MVAANFPLQSSSLLELARAGDFSALAYWINRVLIPDGFYARVQSGVATGCVDVCVECPAPRSAAENDVRTSIIQRICHQLWQLNSAAIYGVKVSGSLPGRADVLWQQSVRIVTPANQRLPWTGGVAIDWQAIVRPMMRGAVSVRDWLRQRYKTLRTLLLAGSAVAAFTLGSWFSTRASLEWVDRQPSSQVLPPAMVETMPMPGSDRSLPETPTIPTADRRSSRSGLARIQSIVAGIAQPGITSVEPPAHRSARSDVVLLFGGDVSFSGPRAGENDRAFADLGILAAADVTSLTLESPLSAVERDEQVFQSWEFDGTAPDADGEVALDELGESREIESRGAIAALGAAGVDAINLANGRILDDGDRGLEVTLDRLHDAEIATVGAGRDAKEAAQVRIIESKGVKIAYLGYATVDYTVARDRRAGVNEALYERIEADIAELRDRVDWIVVNYHWGDGTSSYPAHWQTTLARQTIDAGADAIVGHSPNALQGAETYRDRPIVYSLGKLLQNDKYGFSGEAALLRLRLDGNAIAADFVPIELWDGRPVVASPDSARWIVQRIEDLSQGFARPLARLAEEVDGLSPDALTVSTERHQFARAQREDDDFADRTREDSMRQADAMEITGTETAAASSASAIADTAPSGHSPSPSFELSIADVGSAIAPPPSQLSQPSAMPPFELELPPLTGRLSIERSLKRLDPTLKAALGDIDKTSGLTTRAGAMLEVDFDFQHPDLDGERRDLEGELHALELELYGANLVSNEANPDSDGAIDAPSSPGAPSSPEVEEGVPTERDTEETAPDDTDSPFSQAPMVSYEVVSRASLTGSLTGSAPVLVPLQELGDGVGSWSQRSQRAMPSISGNAAPSFSLEERSEESITSEERDRSPRLKLPRW